MPDRRVVIVAFDGVEPLDVTGPAGVFAMAGGYEIVVAAPSIAPIHTRVRRS
jgi:putative intracellular protease/amidase